MKSRNQILLENMIRRILIEETGGSPGTLKKNKKIITNDIHDSLRKFDLQPHGDYSNWRGNTFYITPKSNTPEAVQNIQKFKRWIESKTDSTVTLKSYTTSGWDAGFPVGKSKQMKVIIEFDKTEIQEYQPGTLKK